MLKLANNFFNLPLKRKIVYSSIWLRLFSVRLRLSLFGFRSFDLSNAVSPYERSVSVDDIASIVERVSVLVPGATCLPKALCVFSLLASKGIKSRIEIGVKPDNKDVLAAHAWVVHNNRILIGAENHNLNDYKTIAYYGSR